ncbi:MAG: hypothetical protein PHW72_03600 [Candidatus Pacebacteria bacterium]|nr:hypothetical protein [Candidatus Paceibacterota bacterium]
MELIAFLFGHDWVYWAVGKINKRLKIVSSVFLTYPATPAYSTYYVYSRRAKKNKWNPWLIGFFIQGGKIGVIFGINASDEDFYAKDNGKRMKEIYLRMEKIQILLSAPYKTFAGTLPGLFFARRLVREMPAEAKVTVTAVIEAIAKIREKEDLLGEPIIILGSKGFIGRQVRESLQDEDVYPVDLGGNTWPMHLLGKKVLLVNITLSDVLEEYINAGKIWRGMAILNEVYPEPRQETLALLNKIGCSIYHISGMRGKSFPLFPAAYRGGIPCCAVVPSAATEVIIKRIS